MTNQQATATQPQQTPTGTQTTLATAVTQTPGSNVNTVTTPITTPANNASTVVTPITTQTTTQTIPGLGAINGEDLKKLLALLQAGHSTAIPNIPSPFTAAVRDAQLPT